MVRMDVTDKEVLVDPEARKAKVDLVAREVPVVGRVLAGRRGPVAREDRADPEALAAVMDLEAKTVAMVKMGDTVDPDLEAAQDHADPVVGRDRKDRGAMISPLR